MDPIIVAIAAKRRALGRSQRMCERLAHMKPGQWTPLESGAKQPTLRTLRRMCFAVGFRLGVDESQYDRALRDVVCALGPLMEHVGIANAIAIDKAIAGLRAAAP